MATPEITRSYINHLCHEIGTTGDAIYNTKTGAWYFSRGSSTIEVFLTTDELQDRERTFIRCFAPLHVLPASLVHQVEFFRSALEINSRYTGIKLGLTADKGLLCAIAERDIADMNYAEMVTLITDVGYYADTLDDIFKKKFGK